MMPKRVFIIGLLFCVAGAWAIYEIVHGLFHDHLYVNLSAFMLPVGIGLFKGKVSSRWWARLWIILGYVLCAALMVMSLVKPSWAAAEWFGRKLSGSAAVPYVWGFSVGLLVILVVLHRLLYSAKADLYFVGSGEVGGRDDLDFEGNDDLRREVGRDHKLYRRFLVDVPGVDNLSSRDRHEAFRHWKVECGEA